MWGKNRPIDCPSKLQKKKQKEKGNRGIRVRGGAYDVMRSGVK